MTENPSWPMNCLEDPDDPWSLQTKCCMCLEPVHWVDGVLIHDFTGKEKCTYKSHL